MLLRAALFAACHLVVAGVAAAQTSGGSGTAPDATQIAIGQRLYREGIRPSGEPLTSVGSVQAKRAGKDAACAACHRRSGYGMSEGRFVIRPIIGPALTQDQTVPVRSPRVKARLGSSQRAPYTEASLARAIRNGIDASGKPLDPAMPRYVLNDAETKALVAYLFTLSALPSPGVDEQDIHFATVIQPGVAPARSRAMLDVMRAFVKDKGGSARQDEARRDAGNMRMARSYRRWVLHVWELSGPSETWNAQLEDFYSKQPVFALIGGLGDSSWRPVHEFSERLEIPSVFPLVDQPVASGPNNYNLYFTKGVVLDAEVLAKFLREQGESGKVVQVYRRDSAGATAASTFRKALAAGNPPEGQVLEDQILEGNSNEAFWRRVHAASPSALVLWLGAEDLDGARGPDGANATALYLSSNLLAGRFPAAILKGAANARLVYPSDLPPKRDARLLRDKLWLHNKGIPITDEAVQINTLFAMTVVSDVVGHIMDSFSRDYFVERLEHVVGQTPMASIYPSVSLGPGQRFAAKGSSVVQVLDADKKQLKALSGWIVP
jgi:Periplasmic binding protein/Cytochrome c